MSRSSDAAIDDMNRRRGMTSESEELHTVRKQLDRDIQEVARLKTELLKAHADLDDATSKDSIGAPCGEDLSGETVYCSYALITYGVRGTFREKDACINKEDSKCCGNCYEASGAYKDMGGVECGGLDATHLYYCLVTNNQGSDRCANADTHRCCRSNSPQSTGGAGGTSGGSETPGCDFELPGQIENPGSCPWYWMNLSKCTGPKPSKH